MPPALPAVPPAPAASRGRSRLPPGPALPGAGYNFDHPSAFDQEAILKCLSELKVGAPIGRPPAFAPVT